MFLDHFFQLTSIPANAMSGSYDLKLVLLSYIVASAASYIALDITGRLRDIGNTRLHNFLWLLGGAFAMGAGIWSMHFIGMLAFNMKMPMNYDAFWTGLSMVVAILASGFALYWLKEENVTPKHLVLGGIILGLGIVAMHYLGMTAMTISMNVNYLPSLFFLSVFVAIFFSGAAFWIVNKAHQSPPKIRYRLKMISALIVGAAICGMHYIGMFAAVFTPIETMAFHATPVDPAVLSVTIAIVTFFILGVALTVSSNKEISNIHSLNIARQTGMAEVATNVLHNVGNVLNSVNVSASLVIQKFENTELSGIVSVNDLLNENKDDLPKFLSDPVKAAHLVKYLNILADSWQQDHAIVLTEMNKLMENIQHIKDIIAMQQVSGWLASFEHTINLDEIINEALMITEVDFVNKKINVEKTFAKLNLILIDKSKLFQILINLISNAKHALLAIEKDNKQITITTGTLDKSTVFIRVADNGVGIAPEFHTKIFAHGFTTKKTGHGYGLHASALAAKDMGGSIKVHSDGVGKGAVFTLELPYKIEQSKTSERESRTGVTL